MGGADDQSHSVLRHVHRFNAARGFVGGAAKIRLLMLEGFFVSMPHAALWVVQRNYMYIVIRIRTVSMPHAALWVVQL